MLANIPVTQTVIEIKAPGGPEVLVPATRPIPEPRSGEVLIRIAAAGVNRADCLQLWTNVFERMRLQAGEVFLVQGGSSGIGITAIQLAKAFGAKVLATAGSDEKCRACRDYGADVAINYRTEDFVSAGKEFTNGRGVDAILDMVGGDYIPRQLNLLAHEGRLCFVALMGGSKVETDFGLIQRKHLTVTGSTLRSRSVEQKAAIVAALKEKVWPLWAAGRLRPFTHKQFPLAVAAEAHRLMESSRHIGKILLVP
jgi:NADPH2:quinone reductase